MNLRSGDSLLSGLSLLTDPSLTYYTTMDDHTLNNWKKIKETFEKSGNTENMFYKRAIKILNGGPDPLDEKFTYVKK